VVRAKCYNNGVSYVSLNEINQSLGNMREVEGSTRSKSNPNHSDAVMAV
jgi:hypothetical protein